MSINFWRTKDGAEVDFVIKKGKQVIGVECKFSSFIAPKYSRSIRNFIDRYEPESVFIINKSFHSESVIGNTKTNYIPHYEISSVVESI